MATITVDPVSETRYRVTVDEDGTRSTHEVTVTAADVTRYAPGVDAARLLEASFEFLLEREPKEAILGRFDLPVIERYFPDYPVDVRTRLA